MKEEIFEVVLTEILEENRQVNKALKEQNTSIKELCQRIEEFEQKLRDQQVVIQPPDLSSVERQIGEGLARVAETVDRQPKPVLRHIRVSFFPECDKEGSYKFFIRWLFGGTILVLLVGVLFFLGRQFLDKWHPDVGQPKLAPRADTVDRGREHRRVKAEKVKKIKNELDYILMRDSLNSLRGNGVNQPQK